MATIKVVLKAGASHVALPNASAGDEYELDFASGSNVGRNGSITVFTDGPNIFGPSCTVVDATGAVVWTQGTGGNSLQFIYSNGGNNTKPQLTPSTPYALKVPVDVDGGARYDFNQPPTPH